MVWNHFRRSASIGTLRTIFLFTFMSLSVATLSGCGGGEEKVAEKQDPVLSFDILEVDQRANLGDKKPDGQYLIVKAEMKNLSNKEVMIVPSDIELQNITDKESERYSQPSEKYMGIPFSAAYGNDVREKLIDTSPINAYPRLKLERYFVFMVPADARPEQYQIFYKTYNLTVPLVSGKTTVHDHRYDQPAPQQ
jgi:hypothetical protein